MKKTLKLKQQIVLSLPILCALQSASALGLGELSVNSALNQPLSATVPIYLSRGENVSAEEIIIGLANPAAHNRAGLPYASILRDLRLSITRSPTGKLHLNINSQRSLYEPLLNFLVDISWENGHLIKEVSILLDPPNYQVSARPAQPVPVIREQLSTTTQITAPPAAQVVAPRKPRPTPRRRIQIQGDSYTVRTGDSLSVIALAARRGTDLSTDEYMEAIYAANPDAFTGSMDRLKADVELTIPQLAELTTPPVAITQKPEPSVESVPEPEPLEPAETVGIEPDTPRLEIVPPDQNLPQQALGTATGTAVETATTVEVTTIAEAAVIEMQTQLTQVQGENSSLQENLDYTRKELTATQDALEKLRIDMATLTENQQRSGSGTSSMKSWVDWLPWFLGALLLALLALLGLKRNKQPAHAATPGQFTTAAPREVASMGEAEIDHPNTSFPDAVPATTHSLLDDDQTFTGIQTAIDDDSTQISAPTELIDTEVDDGSLADMDSAQEAEIYLAYHQYSLAEKNINKLLEEAPDNTQYKLLKLRLLAETGKMDEMQALSVELFREFPDRDEETHHKIQAICEKAFTASTPMTAVTSAFSATSETEALTLLEEATHPEISSADEMTHPELDTSETILNEDMTDFLSDSTFTETTPVQIEPDELLSELDKDTISVEDQGLTIPEYRQAADDINYIAEDLTEEGLDLPFDLETEILEEEERRIAASKADRKDNSD